MVLRYTDIELAEGKVRPRVGGAITIGLPRRPCMQALGLPGLTVRWCEAPSLF